MGSIRKAVLYSSVTRYSMRFMGLASAMIIARLLTPEEIGTFAIASAIVMVMSEFRLLGAGSYLVREQELTDEKIRSATGLTVLISWGMGVLIWAMAPWVAGFYELEPIKVIFRILSVSFFLAPFISIPSSILMREFRFRELFIVKLYTTLANILLTISLILAGFSFYALAWGYSLAVLVELMVLLYYRPRSMPWTPAFRGLREIARFGIYTSVASFLKKGVVTAPDMIIGKVGTAAQVGLFSRGLGFIEFVSQTLLTGVKPVVLPYLSDVKRSGGNINEAYIRASVMLGGLLSPVLAVASVVSLPAIYLFFGHQWIEAASFASWIAFWAMFRAVHWFSSDLLVARGFEHILVLKEAVSFFVHFIVILYLYRFGLDAVAIGFAVAGFGDLVLTTLILWKFLNLSPMRLVTAWRLNFIFTLVCGSGAWLIYYISESYGLAPVHALLFIAVVMPFLWVSLIASFNHELWPEVKNLIAVVRRK